MIKDVLTGHAPRFCQFVRWVHAFRMDEWSDVTALLASRAAAGLDGAEELAEQKDIHAAATEASANG